MQKEIETLLHKIYIANDKQSFNSYSLMSGLAGKTYFDFHYNRYFNNDNFNDSFSGEIQNIAANLQTLNGAGLCNGRAGADYFFYFLYRNELLEKNDIDFFNSDLKELAQVALQLAKHNNFDFLHGATGIAHYLLHNEFFNDANFFKIFLDDLLQAVLNNAFFKAVPEYQLITGEVKNASVNLGMAHGIASVLKFCIECYKENIYAERSKKIASFIISFYQQHNNKTINSSSFSNRIVANDPVEMQSRLAWCYGDLIIGKMLLDAAAVFEDKETEAFAYKILYATTQRKTFEETNVYDACFCHGSAGIAYIYKKLFIKTKNMFFESAANFWLQKTISFLNGNNIFKMYDASVEMYKPNYSLIDGISGTGLVLYSFLSNDFDWDVCFMLND